MGRMKELYTALQELSSFDPTCFEDVKVLEFHKADHIHEQSRPARDRLREELEALLA